MATGSIPTNNVGYKPDIRRLYQQLNEMFNQKPRQYDLALGYECCDPDAQPLFWISQWLKYSKHGFSYELNDKGMGVRFNDSTKLIMLANGIDVHHIDQRGNEQYMTVFDYPKQFEKKIRLLMRFKRHMKKKNDGNGERDEVSRVPHLHSWIKTSHATIMHLTNGSVQLNLSDRTILILCPRMGAVTYVDNLKQFHTYKFTTIARAGCSKDLYKKLHYAHGKLKVLLAMLK